jgi:anti-sigma-K factor RskA
MKTNGTPLDGSAADGRNGSPAKNDAEWSAMRYVLGEMNADEAAAFELLLANDLESCEQVAMAARLAGDLYSALAIEVDVMTKAVPSAPAKVAAILAPTRSVGRELWAVVGVVAAVCLLVAGGLSLLPRSTDQPELAALDRADAGAGSLVAIWTERSAETAADLSPTGAAGPDRVSAEDVASFTSAEDADDVALVGEEDYDVPGWMIAAVGESNLWSPDGSATEVREN